MGTKIIECILCKSSKVALVEDVPSNLINTLYSNSFSADFNKYFHDRTISFLKCENCLLKFFDSRYAGDAAFYELLQAIRPVYYSGLRPEFVAAKKYILNTHKILEVGSGSGDFARYLNAAEYTGLEFNDLAISEAYKKGILLNSESIQNHSAKNLGKYDVVISHHVHEHIADLRSFISAGVDALKVGGLYIFSVPNNKSPETSCLNHVLNMPPHHISRFSLESLKYLEHFDLILTDFEIIGDVITFERNWKFFKYALTSLIVKIFYNKIIVIDGIVPYRINQVMEYTPKLLKRIFASLMKNSESQNILVVYKKK